MGVAEDLKNRIRAMQEGRGEKAEKPAKTAKTAKAEKKPVKTAKVTKPAKKEKAVKPKAERKPVKAAKVSKKIEKPAKKNAKPVKPAKASKPVKGEKRGRGGYYGHPRTLDRDKDTDGLRPFERKMMSVLEKAGGELPIRNLAAKTFGMSVDDVPGEAADGKPSVRAVRNGIRIPIKLGFAELTGRGVVGVTKLWKNRDKSSKKGVSAKAKEAAASKRTKKGAQVAKPKKIKTGRSKKSED
jgi:hypothetical protein